MRARLYVLMAAVLFSTGGAAIKLCTLSSWQIAGFRSGVAALVLWVLLPAWRRIDRFAVLVGIAYGATMILFVTANTLTTAANAIFLQTTAPLYVLFLAPWLLGEKTRLRDVPVFLLMGAGLLLLFSASEPGIATAPDPARGNVVAAASGVGWALTIIGLRWLSQRTTPGRGDPSGAAVIAGNVFAFAVCLPFAFPVHSIAPAIDAAVLVYLGVFQIGLAYVCLVRGMRDVRASEVALLLLLEPILNAGWAWLIHGEVPTPRAAAGCALVAGGLLAQAILPRASSARR